jgi:hypothetical protein
VSAVRMTTDELPAEINPASDFTGPENVLFAIISSVGNKFYSLGLSARSVYKTIVTLVLSIINKKKGVNNVYP